MIVCQRNNKKWWGLWSNVSEDPAVESRNSIECSWYNSNFNHETLVKWDFKKLRIMSSKQLINRHYVRNHFVWSNKCIILRSLTLAIWPFLSLHISCNQGVNIFFVIIIISINLFQFFIPWGMGLLKLPLNVTAHCNPPSVTCFFATTVA